MLHGRASRMPVSVLHATASEARNSSPVVTSTRPTGKPPRLKPLRRLGSPMSRSRARSWVSPSRRAVARAALETAERPRTTSRVTAAPCVRLDDPLQIGTTQAPRPATQRLAGRAPGRADDLSHRPLQGLLTPPIWRLAVEVRGQTAPGGEVTRAEPTEARTATDEPAR